MSVSIAISRCFERTTCWTTTEHGAIGGRSPLGFLPRNRPRVVQYMSASILTPPLDTGSLRQAFGYFATGVTIVTVASDAGEVLGITISSFTPISLDPALVAWSIQKRSSALRTVLGANHFAVNVLSEDGRHLSDRFTGRGDRSLTSSEFFTASSGCPVLHAAMVSFECDAHAFYELGDHFMILGKVSSVILRSLKSPLIFFRGQYRAIQPQHAR